MAEQQEAINATYDAQIAALTEVSTINTEIANQKRDQLVLATALTSCDISAAASAAQTMRANNAQAGIKCDPDKSILCDQTRQGSHQK
jgi:hypothetical protein